MTLDGKVDVTYNQTLAATGTQPITWNIEAGTLPTGITLNETTGEISGTPTVAGMFYFTVKATNAEGSDTKELVIYIDDVSIEELRITNYELRVYPNPTSGVLNLIQETINNEQLTINNVDVFDVYGRKQKAESRKENTSHSSPLISINISHLQAGIYFVRILTEQGVVTKKVVKY